MSFRPLVLLCMLQGLFVDVDIGSVYTVDPDYGLEADKTYSFVGQHDGFE